MDLKRLELTLTRRCNSQCIYCQADAGPWQTEVMKISDAYDYLEETVKVANLESFLLFGGEPMLYPTRALAIIKKAKQVQIPRIEMLTNGTSGRKKSDAMKMADKLKSSGLNVLGVSVDAFHLEFIPLKYPKNSAESALKAGIEQVVWNVAVLESLDGANHYDRLTKHLLETLKPVGIEAHVHKVSAAGRALRTLSQYFERTSMDGPCEGETPMENTVKNPRSITIEPSGEVDICWHLSIGNAKETPLSEIICGYDWRKNRTIKTLAEEGPTGLVRQSRYLARRFDRSTYVNKCHLCVELRRIIEFEQNGVSQFQKDKTSSI